MSKTIEEIKEQYANDFERSSFEDMLCSYTESENGINNFIMMIDEIAQRYAQSKTQELQEHNDNLANNLLEMSNLLVGLIKENNNLKDLSNTITGLQLQEQNAELVEMLEYIFYKTNFQSHFPTTSIKVKNLLTKHNHLKSNTNGN